MKSVLVFIFCFFYFVFFGQNLIANGGFEERNCEPFTTSNICVGCQQLHCCNNWFNPVEKSTPDYFTTNTSGCSVKIPNTSIAFINSHSGNAIVGILTYWTTSWSSIIDYKEYISTKLITPLEKFAKYDLTISLAKGLVSENAIVCGLPIDQFASNNGFTNHFGFYFSLDSLYEQINEYLYKTPQIEIEEVVNINPTEWKTYHLSFIADEEYKYLTIGNFYPKTETTIIVQNSNSNYDKNVYYFIDDVSLEQDLTYHPEGKIIEPNVFTPNGDGVNDFFVPVLAEHIESYELSILNRWGEQVFFTNKLNVGWDGKIGDNIGPDGVYYWNMIYKDNNGKEGIQRGYLTLLH